MRRPLILAAVPAVVVLLAVAGLATSLIPTAGRAVAQQPPELLPAPARGPDEGAGPFGTLVIRGATLIDGTGAKPRGPVDIVIEGNRIADINTVQQADLGDPRPPFDADHEVDAKGKYVTPGFIDLHAHAGGPPKNAEAEYPYKLWLAHGVTSVRGVPLAEFDFTASEKQRSARNEIVAPRIFDYPRPAQGWDRGPIGDDPQKAREWIRWAAEHGADGFKLRDPECGNPAVMKALLDEAKKQHLGSTTHLAQICIIRAGGPDKMNALIAARDGSARSRISTGTWSRCCGRESSCSRPATTTATSRCGSARSPTGSTRSTSPAAGSGGSTCASSAGSGPCSTRRSTSTSPAAT